MLDTLLPVAGATALILGFFVSAQFLHQQFEIVRKLDELREQENVKAKSSKSK